MRGLLEFLSRPLGKRVLWVGFAVLFYQSGQAFTLLVLSPESFAGGWSQTMWAFSFPLMLPAFFLVNARLGCAAGCREGHCESPEAGRSAEDHGFRVDRMPG